MKRLFSLIYKELSHINLKKMKKQMENGSKDIEGASEGKNTNGS